MDERKNEKAICCQYCGRPLFVTKKGHIQRYHVCSLVVCGACRQYYKKYNTLRRQFGTRTRERLGKEYTQEERNKIYYHDYMERLNLTRDYLRSLTPKQLLKCVGYYKSRDKEKENKNVGTV
jgi:hypothetical protein